MFCEKFYAFDNIVEHFIKQSKSFYILLKCTRNLLRVKNGISVQFLRSNDQHNLILIIGLLWTSKIGDLLVMTGRLRSLLRWRNWVCGNVRSMFGAFDHLVRRTLKSSDYVYFQFLVKFPARLTRT